jgi:catechol 2,3-dioxygenase-like lactoylglutathione lyase family enzyme
MVRIARPTLDLERTRSFYEDVVGLAVIATFTDHDGFDGVIFALWKRRVQLELVRSPHGDAPTPGVEDALVVYHRSADDADVAVTRLRTAGAPEIPRDDPALNPYWPQTGARVFVDPDGYRLIVTVEE